MAIQKDGKVQRGGPRSSGLHNAHVQRLRDSVFSRIVGTEVQGEGDQIPSPQPGPRRELPDRAGENAAGAASLPHDGQSVDGLERRDPLALSYPKGLRIQDRPKWTAFETSFRELLLSLASVDDSDGSEGHVGK